jgi:hypothetical protein
MQHGARQENYGDGADVRGDLIRRGLVAVGRASRDMQLSACTVVLSAVGAVIE